MNSPNPYAGSVRSKLPGAPLLLLVAALAASFAVMAVSAGPAHPDTFTVTNTNNSGPGSLRSAINSAAPSGDTITFAPNVTGTITVTSGVLEINKNLTIEGPGAGQLTISGDNRYRAFYIEYGKTVRISDLTITKGYPYYSSYEEGGGIYNEGNLTLTRSVVRGNSAYGGSIYSNGGGIYNANVLTLNGSVVRDNFADNYGGGIFNDFGTLTVQGRSTISGNTAGSDGGGINSSTSNPAKVTITNSTISGNSVSSADGAGGGIYKERGLMVIEHTTIKSNVAPGGQGSGVYSIGADYGTIKVFSSIIAGNKNSDVDWDRSIYGNPFTSGGYNLIGDGNATRAFDATGDRVGVTDPGSVIIGTPGDDALGGTSDSDVVSGLGGSDTIRGLGGGDIIRGGEGNDTIYGEEGSDHLFGVTGVDKVYGGLSADLLNVRDSRPNDLAEGGIGTDTCRTDSGDTRQGCER